VNFLTVGDSLLLAARIFNEVMLMIPKSKGDASSGLLWIGGIRRA